MIIAAAGQAGNGKNQLIEYLVEKLNLTTKLHWELGSFASNVKRIFCETFDVDNDFIEKWKRIDECPPGFNMPVRNCLTFIGDGFRRIQNNIWIEKLLKNNTKNLCLADMRYINESNYVRKNKGITILMWRPGYENNIDNASEQEVMEFVKKLKDKEDGLIEDFPFDFWIKNDGDIMSLYDKVDKIIIPVITKLVNDN